MAKPSSLQLVFFTISLLTSALLAFGIYKEHKNLTECEKNESLKCPAFLCKTKTDKCGYAPYRCLKNDAGSSTCTGDNMVCQAYTATAGSVLNKDIQK